MTGSKAHRTYLCCRPHPCASGECTRQFQLQTITPSRAVTASTIAATRATVINSTAPTSDFVQVISSPFGEPGSSYCGAIEGAVPLQLPGFAAPLPPPPGADGAGTLRWPARADEESRRHSIYPGAQPARLCVLAERRSYARNYEIGGASCWTNYRVRLRPQRSALPHQEVILKSLSGWIVTGLDRSQGRCSAKSRGWHSTTFSGTIFRSVLARNTSQRLRHRAGNHSHIFSGHLSAASRASRFSSRSWMAAKPNGGSTFKNNSASAQASRS